MTFQGIYHFTNWTINDDFIPIKTNFAFYMEAKYVTRVQGAKSNSHFYTMTSVLEFTPNEGSSNKSSGEIGKMLRRMGGLSSN
jgi:hypothetical protein